MASESFRVLAAGYEQAGAGAAGVLREAAAAVRRYGARFECACEAVKRLQREAERCVDEIELWERRRADAGGREVAARTRATDAMLGAGLDPSGGALAAQAQAYREADAAAADRLGAERRLAAAREELEELRKRAVIERERAEEAESRRHGRCRALKPAFRRCSLLVAPVRARRWVGARGRPCTAAASGSATAACGTPRRGQGISS